MADELYVLNEGINVPTSFTASLTADTFNTNTSTNPRVVTKSSSSGTTYLNCYEIHDEERSTLAGDMSLGNILNRYHPTGSTVEDYGVNLFETPGNRVVIDRNLTSSELALHDYFVVVYADNPRKHHVAKVTDVSTYSGTKTNIDFTPALKENIAGNTKVTIYQGPSITGANPPVNTLIAVGYGLLKTDNGDDRHGNYVEVSEPTFYFYKQLEADTKYQILKQTNIVGVKKSVFKTAPLTSNFIVDKSPFSQNATIVDNNKLGDEATTKTNYTQYDGTQGNYTQDITDWANSCKNYDFANTYYPTYIKPVTSPFRNQYMGNLMNVSLNRSITNKGNMAEVKFIDSERMLEKKINDFENFNIKEVISGRETVSYAPNSALPGVYNGTSANTITVTELEDGIDLRNLLGSSAPYELIYITDSNTERYYVITNITAPSGNSQTLTLSHRRNATGRIFSTFSTTPSITNGSAFRNKWSSKVNNLLVQHQIDTTIESGTIKRNGITLDAIESDVNGLEYIFTNGLLVEVEKGDKQHKYVELKDTKASHYYTDQILMSSVLDSASTNKEVFNGNIEYIETDTEGGLFTITISGRDEISTLLSYPINKNLIHSNEWVTSTISPITDTFTDTGLDLASTGDNLNTSTIYTSGTSVVDLHYGDVLYAKYDGVYTPLGVVKRSYDTGTSNDISIINDCLIEPNPNFNGSATVDGNIYVGKNKLLAGKSLHNHNRTTPHSSLYGAADKGMVFYGTAKTITKTGSTRSNELVVTDLNRGTDSNDYGVPIEGISALEGSSNDPKDSPYGVDFDFRIVGSLSNLHIIGQPTELDSGETSLEIGNISPIVMARMDLNSDDSFYTNSIGLYFLNKQGIDRGGFIHLLDHFNDSENKGSTWRRLCVDDRKQQTNTTNYAFRFGSPIFRFNNFTDTKLRGIRNTPDNKNPDTKKTYVNQFYNKTNMISGYADAIRAMGSGAISKTFYKDYTNSWQKEKPVEQTWRHPVNGSTHQDITIYDNAHRNARYNYSNRLSIAGSTYFDSTVVDRYQIVQSSKQLMEMDDPMSDSFFLFAPGDMMPESQKRADHIFFNGTNVNSTSDYFLLIKYRDSETETSTTHREYEGSTDFTKPLDKNYDLLPINNNVSTNPKRFNLLRMVPVTYDSYMNEVDYETYPLDATNEEKIENLNEPSGGQHGIAQSIPTLGYSVYRVSTTSATSTSNNYIDVTTTLPFANVSFDNTETGGGTANTINFVLFTNPADDSTGYSRFLGITQYTHSDTTATKIRLLGDCYVDGYTGEILMEDRDDAFATAAVGRFLLNSAYDDNVIMRNKSAFKYPFTISDDVEFNHNIHRLGGFNEYIENGTINHNSDSSSKAYQVEFSSVDTVAGLFDEMELNTRAGGDYGFTSSNSTRDITYKISDTEITTDDNSASGYMDTGGVQIADGTTGRFRKRKQGNFIFFNYKQKNMYRGTRQFKHKGNIRFVDHVANGYGGTNDAIKIEFESFTDTQIDLTNHFAANDTITISGVVDVSGSGLTETANNTDYIVTSVANSGLPSAGSVGQVLVRASDASVTLANISAFQSDILITNTTTDKSVTNMGCHPNRFINNMSRREILTKQIDENRFTNETINTFNGLFPVLVYAGDSEAKNWQMNNFNERSLEAERKNALKTITNIGVRLKHDAATPESTAKNYGGVYDAIELEAETYWNRDPVLNLSSEDVFILDDAILLFGANISATYSNVEVFAGTNSKYTTDEGFIRIEVEMDLDNTAGSWTTADLRWIDFVPNLTGKMLVKTTQEFSSNKERTVKGSEIYTHNILNHTISKAESSVGTKNVHYLHIDNYSNFSAASWYDVFKFATKTLQEDKLNYRLYEFSRRNIINPLTGKFFESDKSAASWYNWETNGDDAANPEFYENLGFENNGALLGMYVVAELDGAGSSTLVHRNDTSLFVASSPNDNQWQHDTTSNVYITDGINNLKTPMHITYQNVPALSASRVTLNFGDMKTFVGSVSIGSIFNLNVFGNIRPNIEYVKIVVPFNVVPEAEQAVDQILGENNITYTVSSDTDKYYLGNNFTGENAYSACNKLLENKDLKLHVKGSEIKVVSNEEDKLYRAVSIDEGKDDVKVVQIKKDKSLLDNFNEVIVYGDSHKGIARNYNNIKKVGRARTKEIFDYTITSQTEVDRKAIKMLKLFSNSSSAIEISLAEDLPLLEPGNIITVNYPSEGIARDNYQVIEIQKTLGMPTKLLLGQYNKDLSNTLSGLLSITTDLQGNTKRKIYASTYVPNVNIQTVKLKFVQAKVTKSTGNVIGFTYTIGFDAGIGL